MLVRDKNQLLSTCSDSLLELKQYTEVLESAGYTKQTIDSWMPTTVDGAIQLLWSASVTAHDSIGWARAQYSEKNFAQKMAGSILETLYEAVVNSQRYQRVLPGNPEYCYHRGDFRIPDKQTGSPDKIEVDTNGEFILVNIKSSPDPTKIITVNKANTNNILGWQKARRKSDPNDKLGNAKVKFLSNVGANKSVLAPADYAIFGNKGGGSLSQLIDNKNSIQFWRDFWNALWETQNGQKIPISSKFSGLYQDQKDLLFDPINNSTSMVITALGACGVGKTLIIRELVRTDYASYNIDGKGIYALDFPRLVLGSQHNDTFSETDTYDTIVNTSSDNYKHHFTPGNKLRMNIATTIIKDIAKNLIEYAYSDSDSPMLILNTDKGLPRLRKAFEMIKSGDVFLKEDANPEWTYKRVVKLCKQFHHDEAHNLVASVAPKERKQKTQKKEMIKSLKYFNKIFKKSVYWTATKKVDMKGRNKYDMNNTEIFGLVEAEYDFGTAIANGRILPCYARTVFLTADDFVGLSELGIFNKNSEDDEQLTFLIKAIRDHKLWCDSQGISCQIMFFHKDTKSLPHFKQALEKVFAKENIYVDYVTAETDQEDRGTVFETYEKSKFSVLMNYDIIAEGIDIHSTTAVVIGRGMNDIKIVQACSRGIRLLDEDRQALADGKIKVGDETGWKKPWSWIYLFENEAVVEDTIKSFEVEDLLSELTLHKMVHHIDPLQGPPCGGNKLPEVDPEDQEVNEVDVLGRSLKIRLDQRMQKINDTKIIKKYKPTDDDYLTNIAKEMEAL